MKIFKSCFAMLALALAATSCTNDVLMEQEQVATENFSIKVEMGNNSRSMFPNEDATTQVWSKGDKILVYGGSTQGILTLQGEGGTTTGTFTGRVYGEMDELKYVVYPADHATLKNGKVTFKYDADANSIKYPNTNMPMWGEYNKTKVQLKNLAGAVRVYIDNIPENSTLRLIARGLAGEAEFLPEEGRISPKAYDNYVSSMTEVPNMDIAVNEIPAGTEYVDVPVYVGNPDEITGIEKRSLGIYLNGNKLVGSVPTVPTKIGSVSYKNVPELVWNESAPKGSKLTRESSMDENTVPAEEVKKNTDPEKNYDYLIDTAEKLLWFANEVNTEGNTFEEEVVKLGASIDLNNQKWTPIASGAATFKGTFDGDNFMISNLKVETEGKASAGLFAQSRGVIKNLYLQNVDIEGHYKAGAVVGDGLCAKIENCHVDGGTIISTPYNNNDANHVGGIVGYLSAEGAAYVKDCSVNGLQITAYRDVAGIAGSACRDGLDVTGCTVSNTEVTADMTAEYSETKPANAGAIVGRLLGEKVELSTNTATNVTVEILVATAGQLTNAMLNAADGDVIAMTKDIEGNLKLSNKVSITIDGKNYKLGSVDLNGKDNVTLKNISFDAANAQVSYDGKGNGKQNAIIFSSGKGTNRGSRNIVIDGCKFNGKFANGGVAIGFTDQSKGSGQSGDITIKGCTFGTVGGYYDIYCYYSGYNKFNIEDNVFKSDLKALPIYLGRYQSSVPVVVKGNEFITTDSFENSAYLQAHSGSYSVSFDAANNTFAESVELQGGI